MSGFPFVCITSTKSASLESNRKVFHEFSKKGPAGSKPEINPLVTNGLSHIYHLDDSTFIFRGTRRDFSFLFNFSMKIM